MAADPPPAEFQVSRFLPGGGVQTIYACAAHLAHTCRILRGDEPATAVAVTPADPVVHGCKGHLEAWPTA